MVPKSQWWLRAAALGVAVMFAAAAVACGDDDDDDGDGGSTTPGATSAATQAGGDGDEEAVEATVNGIFEAWNANDLDGFLALFTDAGIVSVFGEEGQTVAEVEAGLGEFFGSIPITNVEITDTEVDGDSATSVAQFYIDGFERNEYTLVDENGTWLIDAEEPLVVEVPDGVRTVHVDLNEFAFGYDGGEIGDGNIAFEAENVGEQEHELALVQVAADQDLDALVQQIVDSGGEEVPPGVVFLGSAADIEPGNTQNFVLLEPLTPGRYVMLCIFPDTTEGPDGTPHALKGMVSDFTVE